MSIIGIGGCSRSGKTELSEALVWHFRQQNQRAFSIHQDNYVFALDQIPTVNQTVDWDTPLSIDFGLLTEAVDFYRSKFDVVVVEGIYAFNHAPLNEWYDTCFYVQISKQTYWQRRSAETRWGVEPDWYLEHVWQAHQQYGSLPQNLSNLHHISGETPYDMKTIEAVLRTNRPI